MCVCCCEGPHRCPPFQQLDCQLINPPQPPARPAEKGRGGEGKEGEEELRGGGKWGRKGRAETFRVTIFLYIKKSLFKRRFILPYKFWMLGILEHLAGMFLSFKTQQQPVQQFSNYAQMRKQSTYLSWCSGDRQHYVQLMPFTLIISLLRCHSVTSLINLVPVCQQAAHSNSMAA